MKVIDEKGKLFGIINVVDLLVLLAAAAVICGVAWQLLGSQVKDAVAPQVELKMVVAISGSHPLLVEEVERQNLVGQELVSGNAYLNATITRIWQDDYVEQHPNSDGQLVNTTDPTKKTIMVEITTEVAKGTPSPKIGSQEARAGKTFIVKTQTFECAGIITYVEIAD